MRLRAKITQSACLYLDLVYQWRQIADEFEVLEGAKLKGVDRADWDKFCFGRPADHPHVRSARRAAWTPFQSVHLASVSGHQSPWKCSAP